MNICVHLCWLIDQAAARPANRLADRSFAFAASVSRFRGGVLVTNDSSK
jgi:hypothetical protein